MPERRVSVRLSEREFRELDMYAGAAGVTVGGLVRECAVRFALQVATEVSDGRVRMRRRPGPLASAAPEQAVSVTSEENGERDLSGERGPSEDLVRQMLRARRG